MFIASQDSRLSAGFLAKIQMDQLPKDQGDAAAVVKMSFTMLWVSEDGACSGASYFKTSIGFNISCASLQICKTGWSDSCIVVISKGRTLKSKTLAKNSDYKLVQDARTNLQSHRNVWHKINRKYLYSNKLWWSLE